MILNKAKINNYKIQKIIKYFCLNLTTTQTNKLLKSNRKIINRYYLNLRIGITLNKQAEF